MIGTRDSHGCDPDRALVRKRHAFSVGDAALWAVDSSSIGPAPPAACWGVTSRPFGDTPWLGGSDCRPTARATVRQPVCWPGAVDGC